jgi:AcrR family transcriptional regulator
MAVKQKEKTQMTRRELKSAALHLYISKGYEETAIRDITDYADYAVGTFYRHWQSKQQLLMELWDDFASAFIKESVENKPQNATARQMIDYLMLRSNAFSEHEITKKLFITSQILSAQSGYEDISAWAQEYTEMLYRFLRESASNADETYLRSTAAIMHTILNAHAIQNVEPHIVSRFDDRALAECLLAMVSACSN